MSKIQTSGFWRFKSVRFPNIRFSDTSEMTQRPFDNPTQLYPVCQTGRPVLGACIYFIIFKVIYACLVFPRSWTVNVSSEENHQSLSSNRELLLEQKLKDFVKKFEIYQSQQNRLLNEILNETKKTKGKGKASAKNKAKNSSLQKEDSCFINAVQEEAQRRLRSFLQTSEFNPNSIQEPCCSRN